MRVENTSQQQHKFANAVAVLQKPRFILANDHAGHPHQAPWRTYVKQHKCAVNTCVVGSTIIVDL
jgi:hypothetical protein